VQQGDAITDTAIRQLSAGLYAKSSGLSAASGRAVGLLSARVRLQAYSLTFIDGFHLIAWACVAALLLIALLKKSPLHYGELGFPEEESSTKQRTNS
jgi:DHA2 family multidrug resistance protein